MRTRTKRTVLALALSVALASTGVPAGAKNNDKKGKPQQQSDERKSHRKAEQEQKKAEQELRRRQRQETRAERERLQERRRPEEREQQRAQEIRRPAERTVQRQERLSAQRQQQLIEEQRRRTVLYHQHLQRQESLAQQRLVALQRQRRVAQHRFQAQYLQRLRQQQLSLANQGRYDYSQDPFYYTAPSYRYARQGQYYEVNQYAAQLLQQAVNVGYQEGFRTAQADRSDRWADDYRSSYAYQDANYGYDGRYVDRDEYNYYFREGFRRGYEDGYYSRSQYGTQTSGGTFNIIAQVLSEILNLQSLR